jgi:hypothetical protein
MKVLLSLPLELVAWMDTRAKAQQLNRSAWMIRMLEVTRKRLEPDNPLVRSPDRVEQVPVRPLDPELRADLGHHGPKARDHGYGGRMAELAEWSGVKHQTALGEPIPPKKFGSRLKTEKGKR